MLALTFLYFARYTLATHKRSSLIQIVSQFPSSSPQLVNLLITFVTSGEPLWRGYFYTVLIFVATTVVTVMNSQSFYQAL